MTDSQRLSGLAKALVFSDGQKVSEMSEFHGVFAGQVEGSDGERAHRWAEAGKGKKWRCISGGVRYLDA
jgi:hypothetical protein